MTPRVWQSYRLLVLVSASIFIDVGLLSQAQAEVSVVPGFESVDLVGRGPTFSSPMVADLTDSPGLEIVVAGVDSTVSVFSALGQELWHSDLPIATCSGGATYSTPAIGDLDSDGAPEIVIGYGGIGNSAKVCRGGVSALSGADGHIKWSFGLTKTSPREKFKSIFSSPAISTDAKGKPVIGFAGFDRKAYILNGNGTLRWAAVTADTSWSSPAFVDTTGDGVAEMIQATDISKNTFLQPPTSNGGLLYSFFTSKPRVGKSYGFREPNAYDWLGANYSNEVFYSSPIIGEILPSNRGREIVIGTGPYFGAANGKALFIIDAATGKKKATIALPSSTTSATVVGDLLGDGTPLLVALIAGKVLAINPVTGETIWEKIYADDSLGTFRQPLLVDLDGNGSLEVIVTARSTVRILQGSDGVELESLRGGASFTNNPAVADLDGDGALELIAVDSGGGVHAWTGFDGSLGSSLIVDATPYRAPCPQTRCSIKHAGISE